jgi:hypothetical protein
VNNSLTVGDRIYLGPSQIAKGAGRYLVYHTGPEADSPGEIRRHEGSAGEVGACQIGVGEVGAREVGRAEDEADLRAEADELDRVGQLMVKDADVEDEIVPGEEFYAGDEIGADAEIRVGLVLNQAAENAKPGSKKRRLRSSSNKLLSSRRKSRNCARSLPRKKASLRKCRTLPNCFRPSNTIGVCHLASSFFVGGISHGEAHRFVTWTNYY